MLVIRFKVTCVPEKAEQVRAALERVIGPAREVEGVLSFDIARDLADPNSFIATEVFEDEAAVQRQESLPQVADVFAVLGDALAAPPEATVYHVASAEERSV